MQLDALQSLALSVAAARSQDSVLHEVVQGLGTWDGVALARVWLLHHPDQGTPYLELQASMGASRVDPAQRWNRTDGSHHRIPLSYGKVGQVAASNHALLLQRGAPDWILQQDWADTEGIESFAGQPLCFKGQVLGVMACFSRRRLEKTDLDWLRIFAEHAALAIANARAFEEIAQLKENAERERDYLREAVRSALKQGEIIAESAAMRGALAQVRAVAPSDSSVLLLGESGVGKELIAAALHDMSPRHAGPLVTMNCANVPRALFERELFGHVRGAFNGASRDRQGRVFLADGGSLFLDQIGELPLEHQSKLLRVLQERGFEPVGDERARRVDVRVIAATNRPLGVEVESGRFGRELFERLSAAPIVVPPLRERREDILPLARQFLEATSARLNLPRRSLSASDEARLENYEFPGNVRELQNLIERALLLANQEGAELRLQFGKSSLLAAPAAQENLDTDVPVLSEQHFQALERQNVEHALRRCDWRIAGERGAAQLLGLSPSTLSYRMKQLGVVRPAKR